MTTKKWPRFIWHYVVAFLLLLTAGGFLYTRHRLVQFTELKLEELGVVFDTVPDKQRMSRNLERWHDSSLIFTILRDYQAENNGALPLGWDAGFIQGKDYYELLSDTAKAGEISIRRATAAAALPGENDFHVWPGYVCTAGTSDGYRLNAGVLAYGQIVRRSPAAAFAIVYGAEGAASVDDADGPEPHHVKCLDNHGGYDEPGFVFEAFEQNGAEGH